MTEIPLEYRGMIYSETSVPAWTGIDLPDSYKYNYSAQILKTSYLTQINIADWCTIDFSYSNKKEGKEAVNLATNPTAQLDMIRVKTGIDREVLSAVFNYEYNGKNRFFPLKEGEERLFLKSIRHSQFGQYQFEYGENFDGMVLPKYNTYGIDYWGYWNGKDTNRRLIPNYDPEEVLITEYTSGEREPNPNLCRIGLLSKVTYPTGGSTHISYERHDYGNRIERTGSPPLLNLTANSGIAGGARISRITDISKTGEENIRIFHYKRSLESEESSGILHKWPHMVYGIVDVGWYTGGFSPVHILMLSSDGIAPTCQSQEYVCYFNVIEEMISSEEQEHNGYTETLFSSYNTHPDIYVGDLIPIQNANTLIVPQNKYRNFANGFFLHFGSRDMERGKILEKKFYNNQQDTVRKEYYEYRSVSSGNISSVDRSGNIFFGFWNYCITSKPVKKITTSFLETGNISVREDYCYNSKGQLSDMSATQSNGEKRMESYKYPIDDNMKFQDMINSNILFPIIEKKVYTQFNGNPEKLIFAEQTEYQKILDQSNLYIPELTKRLETAVPITSPGYSNQMKTVVRYDYDNIGRINTVRLEDGVSTVYLWGYAKQYIIAKIENASLAEVKTALNVTTQQLEQLQNEPMLLESDLTRLKTLRTQLPHALVSVYTYEPLVGMTSETNPAGHTIKYEYDTSQRLIMKKDANNSIMEYYEYNHINQ